MSTAESTVQPRLLTPGELATVIKAFRNLRKWSQEQLAEISGLTARTIQRVEQGTPSSADTRRALASAFGFEDIDALNKPYAIPTAEQMEADQEKFDKENITLKADRIASGKQLAKLAEIASADMFSTAFDLPREADEAFAELTDYLREYRDCSDLYSEADKFPIYDELNELLQTLDDHAVSLCCATRNAMLRTNGNAQGIRVCVLYVVAFPKGKEPEQFAVARATQFG